MGRAILFFLLVLGIVLGGLMLLRRTAGMRPPKPDTKYKRVEIKPPDDEEDDRPSW
jgi:hypothetical protein